VCSSDLTSTAEPVARMLCCRWCRGTCWSAPSASWHALLSCRLRKCPTSGALGWSCVKCTIWLHPAFPTCEQLAPALLCNEGEVFLQYARQRGCIWPRQLPTTSVAEPCSLHLNPQIQQVPGAARGHRSGAPLWVHLPDSGHPGRTAGGADGAARARTRAAAVSGVGEPCWRRWLCWRAVVCVVSARKYTPALSATDFGTKHILQWPATHMPAGGRATLPTTTKFTTQLTRPARRRRHRTHPPGEGAGRLSRGTAVCLRTRYNLAGLPASQRTCSTAAGGICDTGSVSS